MATKNIIMLNDLKQYQRNSKIKVKVSSLWRKIMNGTEDQTFRVDMLLMDETGTFIYCQCFHKNLHDIEKMLVLDEILLITNPSVSKLPNPKIVEHKYKISLTGKTTVSTCTNWEGPKYTFKFANFKSVKQNTSKENAVIDFIGYVQLCNDLDPVTKRNGVDTPKINFKLRDLDGIEINASLWQEHAVAMSTFMNDKNRDPHVFIIVQFGAINNYHGQISLTNSFEGTRVFINTDVEEMLTFRKQYLEKFKAAESPESSNANSGTIMMSSAEEEFLHNCGFILSRYICSMKTPKKVILVGTITEISNELKWYYRGCNYCKSKVEKKFQSYERDDGSEAIREVWECTGKSCPGLEVHEVIRFRILLKVKDCSSTTTLTMFDTEARKIFGKTAQQCVEEEEEAMNNAEDVPEYPKEFENLIGKKYAFVIKVSNYNIAYQVEQYSITMLTQDRDIISALYKKFDIERLEERYSNEENSFSDADSSNEKSPKDNESNEDVCEIDGPISSPVRKRQKMDVESAQVGKDAIKLLIPKIEKD